LLKPSPQNYFTLNNNHFNLLIALGLLVLVALACRGSGKPAPSEYVGFWTGANGATIEIRANGTGDYDSGGSTRTTVSGGTVDINEAEKTLSIKFAGMGPSFKIDKAPDGAQMTLSGVVYKKRGGVASLEMPQDAELQDLARRTMMDLNDAIQSGDFTAFHKTTAKKLQEQKTPEQVKDAFKDFVDNPDKFNFESVSGMKATFEPAPKFEAYGDDQALSLNGSYPTAPKVTKFEFKYFREDGSWKLANIRVRTTD
jgi:hypothetical protein